MKRILDGRTPGTNKKTLAYTNHTLLPEALEKWPLAWFETMLPRHLEIILEIDRRLLDEVRSSLSRGGRTGRAHKPGRGRRLSAKSEWRTWPLSGRTALMGSPPSTLELLRTTTVKDLAEMFPERFNNKTNGVTPRRWLLLANPGARSAITDAIGDAWITDLSQLRRLKCACQ